VDTKAVSVIIPTLQRALLLREVLMSLASQAAPSWEAIVVDDGSTDDSAGVVADLSRSDARIRWLRRTRDPAGAATCRNIGAEQSSGEFLVFLDSDDLLAPYCLKQRIECLRANPDLDFAIFPMLVFRDAPLDRNLLWNRVVPGVGNTALDLCRFVARDVPWQTTMPIWRRKAFFRVGGWDEAASNWQDWELHVRALLAGLCYRAEAAPPDCFLRRGTQPRISEDAMGIEALSNRASMFRRTLPALRTSRYWNKELADETARLLIHHAERMALLNAPWELVRTLECTMRDLGLPARPWLGGYLRCQKLVSQARLPLLGGALYRAARIQSHGPLAPTRGRLFTLGIGDDALQLLRRAIHGRTIPAGDVDWSKELALGATDAA
jgi:glycosyltransferase involved in cell wall biosynthesis